MMGAVVASVACRGSLLSPTFLEAVARESQGVDAGVITAFRAIVRRSVSLRGASARSVGEIVGAPLTSLLGFEVRRPREIGDGGILSTLVSGDQMLALLAITAPSAPIDSIRQAAVVAAAAEGLRWCLLTNGFELGLLDASRPHGRRSLVFDLRTAAADLRSLQALVAVSGASAMLPRPGGPAPLEAMIARSDADIREASRTLQAGVTTAALALTAALDRAIRRAPALDRLFEESLTVVYRILFLRFAESRGLVPVWHPIYRRGYTIEALREAIDEQRDASGTWDALQAIARLAHRGATAGDLSVVAFNGRLFSPAHAPAVAARSIPDDTAAQVVSALTSAPSTSGPRRPIAYGDLGVEQLGSIYERVLELTPERDAATRAPLLRRGNARKATASFYTPRTLTQFIVRRTLAPLVRDASPEQILELRIVDPAMGSGAFLVAACRELARAYEEALIRSGSAGAGDWTPADRAGFRRLVAGRCLYGVDLNPMAVQLSRLSMWLCSLAAEKPLSFLDHRLRVGNSVLGASPEAITRRAPGGGPMHEPTLFSDEILEAVGRASEIRTALAAIPDDSVAQVHRKEAMLAGLDAEGSPIAAWRRVCDLWCACWFWPESSRSPDPREFGALYDHAKHSRRPDTQALAERLDMARTVAGDHRFFHWDLEFPEVLNRGGFDAVIGNPPWDMMRGDPGARRALRFTRDSGLYRLQSRGHSNLYQLFLERFLQLARPGGRVGVVMPWGLAVDEGSAALRRELFDRCTVGDLVLLDNRNGIFPIHRAVKFCALLVAKGGSSDALPCSTAVADLGELDRPSESGRPSNFRIELSRDLLESASGPSLAVPCLSSPREVRILERLVAAAPPAASASGWHLRFSRELNASDDKALFTKGGAGCPVIAGRHIGPFLVRAEASDLKVSRAAARKKLGDAIDRPRLAYRDVAGAGNRLTLIAAVVPAGVVTTHTLFCLQTRLPLDEQLFLCAVLNSYVANYLVRIRVGTHVTTTLVHSLPIPRPPRGSPTFARIVALARSGISPALHGAVAALYGLDEDSFREILGTFPLVPRQEREAALASLRMTGAI